MLIDMWYAGRRCCCSLSSCYVAALGFCVLILTQLHVVAASKALMADASTLHWHRAYLRRQLLLPAMLAVCNKAFCSASCNCQQHAAALRRPWHPTTRLSTCARFNLTDFCSAVSTAVRVQPPKLRPGGGAAARTGGAWLHPRDLKSEFRRDLKVYAGRATAPRWRLAVHGFAAAGPHGNIRLGQHWRHLAAPLRCTAGNPATAASCLCPIK